jgi:hypothetical protein
MFWHARARGRLAKSHIEGRDAIWLGEMTMPILGMVSVAAQTMEQSMHILHEKPW